MSNNSGLSKRAALRKQQEMEARQARNSKVLGFVLGGIALVVVAILGVVIWQTLAKQAPATPVGPQLTPPNATAQGGIKVLSTKTQPAAGVPHLVVYQDYQCPACKNMEQSYGKLVTELVDSGKITAEFSTAYFLDKALKNDASQRAAMAAAAADQVGKYREYHSVLFENQPTEGKGYTDQQLREEFPAKAGITGDALVKFQKLYDERAFQTFAVKGDERLQKDGVTSTPAYKVNGKQLQFVDASSKQLLIQATATDLLRAITEAAK